MKHGRRILVIASAAVVVLVLAVAGAALLIPADRVAAAVARRAETLLGERVRLTGVSLRFLPLPGVRVTGLSVGGVDDSTALATARSVELRARLLPLLRGDVILSSLDVRSPRVLIEIDEAGRSNLPLLGRQPAAGDSAGRRDIRFAIDRIAVADGRLAYRDRRDGTVIRLDGWDQRLRIAGDVRAGELAGVELAGWLAFDDIDARLPRVVLPVRDLALRLTHDASLDRGADRLELRTLGLALDGVELDGSGAIDSVSSATGRSARLDLRGRGLDAARLLAWAPDSLRKRLALPDGRRLEPGGTAAIDVSVRGPLRADTLPGFDGTLALADGALASGGQPLLSGVRAEAVFSADSVVARLDGSALGEPFSAGVAARTPAAPELVVALSGRADLARLRGAGLLPDTLALEGGARFDLRGRIPTARPSAAEGEGTIELTALRLAGSDPELALPFATVTLEGQRLRIDPLSLRLGGRSELRAGVVAEGWIPALLDSTAAPARLRARMEFDTLDLDALLGEPEGGYPALLFARLRDRPLEDGRSAEAAAEAMGLALPALPELDLEAVINGRRLIRNGLAYSDLEVRLAIRPGAAELRSARFGFMGGTVQGSGRLEPTRLDSTGATVEARVIGQYALDGVGAGSFFDRLTPFRDHLAGSLGLAGTLGLVLDRHALPDRTALTSRGGMAITDGRVANWRILEAATARLGLAALDTVRFRDWAGSFSVTGTQVTLDETVLRGQDLDARAAGAFDLNGRLDVGATLLLSRPLAERAGAVGRQLLAAAGPDDRVPVGLRLTGTVEDPAVSIDLSEARGNVVARAREAAEREAEQLAEAAAGEVLDRIELPDSLRGLPADSLRGLLGDSLFSLLPDSLKLPGDSAATRLEVEVKDRLRRLLRGGG